MDSFADPHKPVDHTVSLADVRAEVRKLEAELHEKGVQLSGRIIQVCHYLPVTCAFSRRPHLAEIPSPPATPPAKASDIPPSPVEAEHADSALPAPRDAAPEPPSAQWSVNVRYGHSAMVSGIDSLASTHEQILIGWTGDIESSTSAVPQAAAQSSSGPSDLPTSKVSASELSGDDKKELEALLDEYKSRDEPQDGKKIRYVPVWLDDKDAHGHYDGYCKQSEFAFLSLFRFPFGRPWPSYIRPLEPDNGHSPPDW